MQNYEQILAELEIEIPEDKKEPLRKAWNQNYKTIADYNKQVEKAKRIKSEVEEAKRTLEQKQAELKEAVSLKEQAETLKQQLQEVQDARIKLINEQTNKENLRKFFSGKKFINSITENEVNRQMLEALEEDNTRSIEEVFDEIVPPELRESVFVSDRAIPAFTTKFNQNQPPEQKEKGIDKLNSMSLSEKMLLRQKIRDRKNCCYRSADKTFISCFCANRMDQRSKWIFVLRWTDTSVLSISSI